MPVPKTESCLGQCIQAIVTQPAEDGAMGIIRACADPHAASGDFYGPGRRGKIGAAKALKRETTHQIMSSQARSTVWGASCEAVGARWFDASA
eukprot:UC1_evm1s1013